MFTRNIRKTLAIASLATICLTGVASACCKAKFERTKPHVNIGTLGHVDHGSARSGGQVRITGFGSFQVRQPKTSIGRNPRTGQAIQIPASKVPAFKAGKSGSATTPRRLTIEGSAAGRTAYDLTPEEYRDKWVLSFGR